MFVAKLLDAGLAVSTVVTETQDIERSTPWEELPTWLQPAAPTRTCQEIRFSARHPASRSRRRDQQSGRHGQVRAGGGHGRAGPAAPVHPGFVGIHSGQPAW